MYTGTQQILRMNIKNMIFISASAGDNFYMKKKFGPNMTKNKIV